MSGVCVRPMEESETDFRSSLVLANVNWCGERFSAADVEENEHFQWYTQWGPGDSGFAALVDGDPVGAAWVRHADHSHGFGFVAAQVPELTVSVLEGFRGLGLGTDLIRRVLDAVRESGGPAVSLSVEDGNPARRLYERLGFVAAETAGYEGAPGTMVAVLES